MALLSAVKDIMLFRECSVEKAQAEYQDIEQLLIMIGLPPLFRSGVVTATEPLNVRAEPNTTSKILGVLKLGTPVQIRGSVQAGQWYLVDEPTGWVKADYVEFR